MLFTRAPKPPVLAAVPKLQKAVTCLTEKVLPWDSFVRCAPLPWVQCCESTIRIKQGVFTDTRTTQRYTLMG